jgi:hypothetical protein
MTENAELLKVNDITQNTIDEFFGQARPVDTSSLKNLIDKKKNNVLRNFDQLNLTEDADAGTSADRLGLDMRQIRNPIASK